MISFGFNMMYNFEVYVLYMGYLNYLLINENLFMFNCKNFKK